MTNSNSKRHMEGGRLTPSKEIALAIAIQENPKEPGGFVRGGRAATVVRACCWAGTSEASKGMVKRRTSAEGSWHDERAVLAGEGVRA